MRFTDIHKSFFKATDGSFSEITEADEATKGQITLTDYEVVFVEGYFGVGNIHVGKASDNVTKSTKQFYLWNKDKIANLKLVIPKPHKPELRLYMNKGEGFSPTGGNVWFVFTRKDDPRLFLGWMPTNHWNSISALLEVDATFLEDAVSDPDDTEYLDQIDSIEAKQPRASKSMSYPRDPNVAIRAMDRSGYLCENDSTHITFLKQSNGKQYMEPHHFVPMSCQKLFENSIDVEENIIILCPTCHRLVHHGKVELQLEFIKKFIALRSEAISKRGIEINLERLRGFYGV